MTINIGDFNIKPLDWSTMVAPLLKYDKDYDTEEEKYQKLAEKMGELSYAVANSQKAKEIYNAYNTALLQGIENFYTNGLNGRTGLELSLLRKNYGLNMVRLEKALDALIKEAELRRRELSSDDSMVYQKDLNLDDFLNGTPDNLGGISANKVSARVASKALSLGLALFSDPEVSKVLGDLKYLILINRGASPSDMLLVLSNNLNDVTNPELKEKLQAFANIINEEKANVGYNNFSSRDRATLDNAINTGMYQGLLKPSYEYLNNPDYMTPELVAAAKWAETLREWAKQDRLMQMDELTQPSILKVGTSIIKVPARYYKVVRIDKNGKAVTDDDGNIIYDYKLIPPEKLKEPETLYQGAPGSDAAEGSDYTPITNSEGNTLPFTTLLIVSAVNDLMGNDPKKYDNLPGSARTYLRDIAYKLLMDKPIYVTSDDEISIGNTNGFEDELDEDDMEILSYDDFLSEPKVTADTKKAVRERINYYGLKASDIEIIKDVDSWTEDHYMVVPKGFYEFKEKKDEGIKLSDTGESEKKRVGNEIQNDQAKLELYNRLLTNSTL